MDDWPRRNHWNCNLSLLNNSYRFQSSTEKLDGPEESRALGAVGIVLI
jgi:hypothetical protein